MDKELIERLRALHVWPQFVADTYADTLLPRQITGLYSVGAVAHEAATQGTADNERIATAVAFIKEHAGGPGGHITACRSPSLEAWQEFARIFLEGKAS